MTNQPLCDTNHLQNKTGNPPDQMSDTGGQIPPEHRLSDTEHRLSDTEHRFFPNRQIDRKEILAILQAAIKHGEYRFARQGALHWLTAYPGDISVSLCYARALIGENHYEQALTILKGLCMADPEYAEALELWMTAEGQIPQSQQKGSSAAMLGHGPLYRQSMPAFTAQKTLAEWQIALKGETEQEEAEKHNPKHSQSVSGTEMQPWGSKLHLIRKSLEDGNLVQAESDIPALLSINSGSPIIALTHLKVMDANPTTPLAAKRSLAEFYRRNWPDCLPITLFLARWSMEDGSAERAVALLHQVVARDIGGQAIERLWGKNHPYKSLWPERLEMAFTNFSPGYPIPALVAAELGWNQLPDSFERWANVSNSSREAFNKGVETENSPDDDGMDRCSDDLDRSSDDGEQPQETFTSPGNEEPGQCEQLSDTDHRLSDTDHRLSDTDSEPSDGAALAEATSEAKALDASTLEEKAFDPKALDELAASLGQPAISQIDARFPVYVIFSVQAKLEAYYGKEQADNLATEMKKLAQVIQINGGKHTHSKNSHSRWNALVFLPDQPENMQQVQLKPLEITDPWSLKLAISDLDIALGKRGEMIGAILIVGGPEIVPFHMLPNPVDDPDQEVPSDNPYSTRDENYFISEWPVGRLPGGSEKDATTLLLQLKSIIQRYQRTNGRQKTALWWNRFTEWVYPTYRPSIGFSAAVWKQASISVFRPIGEQKLILTSPPLGLNGFSANGSTPKISGAIFLKSKVPLLASRLGYFNLHGLEDAPEWYGQRDPQDATEGPDYPVAIRPEDVSASTVKAGIDRPNTVKQSIPTVVFSEACYGAHIMGKTVDQALSMKFLASGTQAVVGSTTMSYGSVMTPLIAADLLGFLFWRFLQEGLTAGEALRRAKIQMASDMYARQGYLDGEDQKTLISFVLYGDPLSRQTIAKPRQFAKTTLTDHSPKAILSGIYARTKAHPETYPTICDRIIDHPEPIPENVMETVKKLVQNYLPGMASNNFANTEFTYTTEHPVCDSHEHICPTQQLQEKMEKQPASKRDASHNRRLVKVSKSYNKGNHTHPQIARLTLDQDGKLVKFVVSR